MLKKIECTSCKRNVIGEKNYVKFECPNCGKKEIVRCERCKKLSVPYICSECGFEGP